MTPRMRDVMLVIQAYDEELGVAPTHRQIADDLRITSKSQIGRVLEALERDGYIERQPQQHRAIQIIKRVKDPRRRNFRQALKDIVKAKTIREAHAIATRALGETA